MTMWGAQVSEASGWCNGHDLGHWGQTAWMQTPAPSHTTLLLLRPFSSLMFTFLVSKRGTSIVPSHRVAVRIQ